MNVRFGSPISMLSNLANCRSTSSQNGVSTIPGAMPLTLILCSASAIAIDCVMLITHALLAQYASTSASPRRPAWEARLTILPPRPWLIICLAAA